MNKIPSLFIPSSTCGFRRRHFFEHQRISPSKSPLSVHGEGLGGEVLSLIFAKLSSCERKRGMISPMNILNVGYSSTNYYILADAKPHLLIDVGFAGTLPKLQHELKRVGIQLADIKHLLSTHYHPDHAGLAQELQGMGIKLIVVDVQQTAIAAVQHDPKLAKQYSPYDKKSAITITLAESRAFLAKLDIQGEIITTPGHSDDSVSLITDDGTAFTGDLTHPMMAGEGSSADVINHSWSAIRAHGAKRSYPGHGPVYPLK